MHDDLLGRVGRLGCVRADESKPHLTEGKQDRDETDELMRSREVCRADLADGHKEGKTTHTQRERRVLCVLVVLSQRPSGRRVGRGGRPSRSACRANAKT